MTTQQQSSLLGYALLKASFDFGNNNPLDALLPIIDRALLNHPNGPIDTSNIQRSIFNSIGLDIPVNVIRYTFPKLRKKQRVALIEYIYHTNNANDKLSAVVEIEKKSREIYSRAVGVLRPLLLGTRFENDHPAQLLEDWLDNSAVSFVGDKTRYAAAARADRDLNWLFRECMEGPRGDQFIDDLSYLAVGDVLFRAIRNLTEFEDGIEDLPDLPAKMQQVQVYFDTRLILRCLGIGRGELVHATNELSAMCRNTGCQLYCFEHTADEVGSSLFHVGSLISSLPAMR